MKSLKKLSKGQLKMISGSGDDFCMYYCNGTVICTACSEDFKCPEDSTM